MKRTRLLLIIAIAIAPAIGFAQTDNTTNDSQHPILTSKFIFNAGVFLPAKSIKISANGNSIGNEKIDFGKTFKFDNKENTFATNFLWRFSKSKKWSVGLEYFRISNKQEVSLDREIEWQDTIYPLGAQVEAGISFNLYRLFFGYAISRGEQHEFGAGLGFHTMDIVSFIQGKAYIGEDDGDFDLDKKSVSAIAPVPNIGLWYFYSHHYKWALTARIDWFAIKINDIDGSLWNVAPGIKFQAWDHIGFGLNYRFFKTSVKMDRKAWDGSLNFRFNGPLFTVSANL